MNQNYKTYIALVTPYSITVSTLFLFGYWSEFDVNIFEYINISEILKISIYQLARYGSFVILGAVLTSVFLTPVFERILPAGEGSDLPEAKFIKKYWKIFALAIVAYALYTALFTNHPAKWLLAAMIIFPLVFALVSNSHFLSNEITSPTIRAAILNPAIMILIFSYGWGSVEAQSHKSKENTVIINDKAVNLLYIGRTGGHVFFWNKDNKTTQIMVSNDVKTMAYHVEPKKIILDSLLKHSNESKP